jgi:membrane protease subunit (stomatin/prohibitin family)
MKITFLKDAELEVVERYDEDDDVILESGNEIYRKGNVIEEVDILEIHEDSVDVQFGDGSVCYGIPLNTVKIEE